MQTSPMLAKVHSLQHDAYNIIIIGRITYPIASSYVVYGMQVSDTKHYYQI